MTYTFKNIYVTMTVLGLLAGGHINGADYIQQPFEMDGNQHSFEINENNCFQSSVFCASEADCCNKGFISIDFLYWRAFEGGLDSCGSSRSIDVFHTNGDVDSFFCGKKKSPHFNWDPGFRIGAGYQIVPCWDLAVYWTDYHSRAHRHQGSDSHFRWKLDFDVVDAVIGRKFDFESNCFSVRPFIGVRSARIHQRARGFFSNSELLTTDREHNREKFTGVGPLVGLEADLNIKSGWGLYANFAASTLWGRFRVKFKESHIFPHGGNFSRLRKHLDASQFVLDAGLGISWRKCFCNNNQFVIKIGLEQHRYFDHNRIGEYGDLCLTGAVVSAAFEF